MQRYREMEKLQTSVRAELPGVAVAWLAALRQPLEELTMAALNGKVGDEEFLKRVEDFAEKIPGLLEEMDSAALAGLMEGAMGAAMANGIAARVRRPEAGDWKEAGLPWEPEALLGARRGGKGKRCGNSWIPGWKQCGNAGGRAWGEVTDGEAGILSRLTGRKFKQGARIFATADAIRHAEKGHKHQLSEKDWKQLRGRLFDARTEKKPVFTRLREEAIQFNFPRGGDQMEAVFTVHAGKGVFPGELRLKTFKMLDPRDILRKKNEDSGG